MTIDQANVLFGAIQSDDRVYTEISTAVRGRLHALQDLMRAEPNTFPTSIRDNRESSIATLIEIQKAAGLEM